MALLENKDSMERNLDLEAKGEFPEDCKKVFHVLQLHSGQIFIIKGTWNPEGNKVSDIYSLNAIPSASGVTMGISRLDQAPLMAESDGTVKISERVIDLSYFLKQDSTLISRLEEADKIAQAKSSGIVLPQDGNNPGIIR